MQGDSFLKYFSSVYVFVFNPALSEGALHKARQHLISNKVLKQCGLAIGLPSYIQGKTFSYKLWQPPNFTVQDASLHHASKSSVAPSGRDGVLDDINASRTHLAPQSQPRPNTPDDTITQWLGDKVKRVVF